MFYVLWCNVRHNDPHDDIAHQLKERCDDELKKKEVNYFYLCAYRTIWWGVDTFKFFKRFVKSPLNTRLKLQFLMMFWYSQSFLISNLSHARRNSSTRFFIPKDKKTKKQKTESLRCSYRTWSPWTKGKHHGNLFWLAAGDTTCTPMIPGPTKHHPQMKMANGVFMFRSRWDKPSLELY